MCYNKNSGRDKININIVLENLPISDMQYLQCAGDNDVAR